MCFLSILFKGKCQISGRPVSLACQMWSACKAKSLGWHPGKPSLSPGEYGWRSSIPVSADLMHSIPRSPCLCMHITRASYLSFSTGNRGCGQCYSWLSAVAEGVEAQRGEGLQVLFRRKVRRQH